MVDFHAQVAQCFAALGETSALECDGFHDVLLAAVSVAVVPFTHSVGGRLLHGRRAWTPRLTFARGGAKFLAFQSLAWSIWTGAVLASALAVASAVSVFSHHELSARVLGGAALCGSALAELFCVSSLLTFEVPTPARRAAAPQALHRRTRSADHAAVPSPFDFGWSDEDDDEGADASGAAEGSAEHPLPVAVSKPTHRRGGSDGPSRGRPRAPAPLASPLVELSRAAVSRARGAPGALLIALLSTAVALWAGTNLSSLQAARPGGRLLLACASAACVCTAVPLTHGLGGALNHGAAAWRFFMPGVGGVAFVGMQAAAWMLYACSLAAFAAAASLTAASLASASPSPPGVAHLLRGAGAAGVGAQGALVLSLLAFKPRAPPPPPLPPARPAPPPPPPPHMAYTAAALLMVYAPCHVVVAAVASLFLLLSPRAAVGTLLAAAALYGRTYAGGPEHSGARTWPWFQRLCGSTLGAAMCRWFGGITLRVAGGGGVARAEGDPPIVFGYHPHGLYPAAAAWFHHTPAWRAAFPGLSPVTLAASALFWAPLLRDVVMWAGARCVSRGALRRALVEERRSVVLVPGGQAELVEHEGGNTTRLVTRHKGFLRHALEARAAVCPIFVFGEAQEQRHLLRAKKMQRWTAKRLGFPFPFLPGGYLGVLPLPEPRPLTFCVGRPILPAGGDSRPPGAPVTDAEVDALHAAYYAQLVALFEQHKVAAGFPDAKLIVD